jgi:hypothetical protein
MPSITLAMVLSKIIARNRLQWLHKESTARAALPKLAQPPAIKVGIATSDAGQPRRPRSLHP